MRLSATDVVGRLNQYDNQTYAWEAQVPILQKALAGRNGRIIFEYGIPGLPKVVDVVLLLQNTIFSVEFKVDQEHFHGQDKEQTLFYALRLKYFHSESHDRIVVPILVATSADCEEVTWPDEPSEDGVFDVVCCSEQSLGDAIRKYVPTSIPDTECEWHEYWESGIFKSSPTIIQTAINIWNNKHVPSLTHDGNNESKLARLSAEEKIKEIIKSSKENGRKSLVFVTGVPGAGKTLVGLNISVHAQEFGASFLSGNDPLVRVLSSALLRNLNEQLKNKRLLESEQADFSTGNDEEKTLKKKIAIESIIRGVYSYKNEIIEKRMDFTNDDYKFNGNLGSQHVIIYDEAQRAWSADRMRLPGRTRKKWQTKNWPFSEPTLLLWDMDKMDWGVLICLVGGGQEINDGESGINEWLRTLIQDHDKIDLNQWDIYYSGELESPEYQIVDKDKKTVADYLKEIPDHKIGIYPELHLTECQRTPLAEELANFINKLVDGSATDKDYAKIKNRYPIRLTRSVDKLKQNLKREQAKIPCVDEKSSRIGIMISSKAERLRPLGFEVKSVGNYLDKVAGWFLDSKEENVDSSNSLEIALTEFLVQGLEIDFGGVIWDADFQYDTAEQRWRYFTFNKNKWTEKIEKEVKVRTPETIKKKEKENIRIAIAKRYMQNAYRVLLTRSRYSLTICVPEGDPSDNTRLPKYYDNTYVYLASLGFDTL